MLKFVFLFLCIVAAQTVTAEHGEEDLKCNFRYCGAELLNFEKFSLSGIFRKIELAQFCVKNCTPPIVHEFFQSIIFAITRRIPGNCQREECTEKNRFVALAKCGHEKAWPLLQCSKRLVDLAQVALEIEQKQQKRNYTCSIVVDTTQCIEEILHECGSQPFSLVQEIFGDVIKVGISSYCHRSFRNDFFVEDPSTTTPDYQERMKYFTDISPQPGHHPYPQFVKGYRPDSASTSKISYLCILLSLALSYVFLFRRW
ncbi:uncharacterized protein LOC129961696 [Argiope bruennichi]|uniref:uncharacterized protein LOC129961696 n=1 Tax=Argiope bruennichi TaxID=94029 RepID=UPI002494AD12|nr:uncharacterized protein LOC129961696 [Argiope bruennichi]